MNCDVTKVFENNALEGPTRLRCMLSYSPAAERMHSSTGKLQRDRESLIKLGGKKKKNGHHCERGTASAVIAGREGDERLGLGAMPPVLHFRLGLGHRWQHHHESPRGLHPQAAAAHRYVSLRYTKTRITVSVA